ncbi:MAG: diphthine--ammonia ligase [Archaeoglobaceae archaeon]
MKVFSSWSGGKESCMACYKAIEQGLDVSYLLNFIDWERKRRSHGVRTDILRAQSEALSIPIIQRKTTWEDYESTFKKVAGELKQENVCGGVFGDIDIQEHRHWVERVCTEVGIKPFLPLWGRRQEELMHELVDTGFKAIIIVLDKNAVSEDFLGQIIDKGFIEELKQRGISPCGESGEYHTLVVDGPIFKKRLDIEDSRKVTAGDRVMMDITGLSLPEKEVDGEQDD